LNELQALTLSGALAVFAFTWLFFGFGDYYGGGMMRPVRQNADLISIANQKEKSLDLNKKFQKVFLQVLKLINLLSKH